MIRCNKCGTSIDDKLRFCTECGAPVTPPPTIAFDHFTPANLVKEERAPSGVTRRTVPIIVVTALATALLLLLGGLAFRFFFTPTSGENNSLTQPLGTKPSSQPEIKQSVVANNATRSSANNSTAPLPTINTSSIKQEVIDTLDLWAATVRAHDLQSHMRHYAERLHTFYLKRDVSSTLVRATYEPTYARYPKLDVRLANIEVSLNTSGTEATVTLDKTYSFEGDNPISGSGREMIWLSKRSDHWLITGLRDLQVYYKR